jgi:putative tributyrin esterase
MALMNYNFESQYLRQCTNVSVILPDAPRNIPPRDFYSSGEKYKVIWLLHGGFGDNTDWWRKSRVEMFACERNVAIVMPAGYNALYSNWPDFGFGMMVYDYVVKELMTLIPAWFPVSTAREDNLIMGLSMGASAALKIGARNPSMFSGIGVLSGMVADMEKEYCKGNPLAITTVRHAGGIDNYLASDENTWRLIKENAHDMPPVYFTCGDRDHNYESTYKVLPDYASQIGLEVVFELEKGFGHEWRFWDIAIERAMEYFGLHRVRDAKTF